MRTLDVRGALGSKRKRTLSHACDPIPGKLGRLKKASIALNAGQVASAWHARRSFLTGKLFKRQEMP